MLSVSARQWTLGVACLRSATSEFVCVCGRVCVCGPGGGGAQVSRGKKGNLAAFRAVPWGAFLLDEAHMARNTDSKAHKVHHAARGVAHAAVPRISTRPH